MYEMPTKESNASRERDATKETHGLISQYKQSAFGTVSLAVQGARDEVSDQQSQAVN